MVRSGGHSVQEESAVVFLKNLTGQARMRKKKPAINSSIEIAATKFSVLVAPYT